MSQNKQGNEHVTNKSALKQRIYANALYQRDNFSPYKPRIYAVWGIQITFLVFNWSLLKSYVNPLRVPFGEDFLFTLISAKQGLQPLLWCFLEHLHRYLLLLRCRNVLNGRIRLSSQLHCSAGA